MLEMVADGVKAAGLKGADQEVFVLTGERDAAMGVGATMGMWTDKNRVLTWGLALRAKLGGEKPLAAPDGPEALFSRATSIGQVSALVNCAGVTFYGRTLEATAETNQRIISLNLLATMQATMLFLRYFLQRREGAILTVTSVAGLVPAPYQNVYAASKHAVQTFMEGIAGEYRGRGVTLCTFAAASMATEMIRNAGLDRRPGASNAVFLDPARTARIALASFKKGRLVLVPGLLYKFAVFLARITSRRFGVWLSERIMRSVVHPAP
jgi:short-subunit dehydrogenase